MGDITHLLPRLYTADGCNVVCGNNVNCEAIYIEACGTRLHLCDPFELHTTKRQLYMCPLAALDHMTVSKICTYIQGMTGHALQVYPQYIGSELEGIISMG